MDSKLAAKGESAATIVDIARMCKVSPASVSRVLTGLRGVKADKRDEILKMAEKVGYRPNRMARRLVTSKSCLLGFIASDLRNTAYLEYFHTLEREVRQEGYEFLIADSERSVERERANINKMLDNRVDGLLLLPVSDWIGDRTVSHLRELETKKLPFVLFGHLDGFKFDSISADEFDAASQLVAHLFDLGHRDYIFVDFGDSRNRPAQERLNGVKRALSQKCVPDAALQVVSSRSHGWIQEVLHQLTTKNPATAIICVNDLLAFKLFRPLAAANINVPQDVSVCGFGSSLIENTKIGELFTPSLTVVEFDDESVAKYGAAMLLDQLSNSTRNPRTSRIPARLLARESTGPARS